MIDEDDRILIRTFPGLPEGAGIYRLPDGTEAFFNCAPGQPPNEIPVPEEFQIQVDPDTGKVIFDQTSIAYRFLKQSLGYNGIDIDLIETEDEIYHCLGPSKHGLHLSELTIAKWRHRQPKNLSQAIFRATILGEFELADKLYERLERRKKLGLKIIE